MLMHFQNLRNYIGGGKQYTRGQAGLDQAILEGSNQSRNKLRSGLSAATRSATDNVRNQKAQSRSAIDDLSNRYKEAQESITVMPGGNVFSPILKVVI